MRANYQTGTLTIDGTVYPTWLPIGAETSTSFLTLDTSDVAIVGGAVYVKVSSMSADVAAALPLSPVDGEIVQPFNIQYVVDTWRLRIS